MHDLISRLFAWTRATFGPDSSGHSPDTCHAARTPHAPARQPVARPAPVGPRRHKWPIDSGSEPGPMLWVTAHGIDIRTRQPHDRKAGR